MDHAPPAPRRELDLAPLTRRVGIRARLRAVAANNVLVIGLTVAVLVAGVPAIILVALLVTGTPADGGAIAFLAFFLLAGAWAVADGLGQAGGPSALARFAEVNDLELLGGSTARHYAAAPFADGSHLVAQGVRTRDRLFVEVGDRFPTTTPAADDINVARLYLRLRLPTRVWGPVDHAALVGDLDQVLTRFAGDWTLDVTYDEVTVLGSDPLHADHEGRVGEAFALADALAVRAAALVGPPPETPRSRRAAAASGIPVPEAPRVAEAAGRPRSALTTVALTVAVLVVVPLAFAGVMSQVDDGLRGDELGATVVVSIFVALVLAVVGLLVRSSVRPRRPRRRRDRPRD